MVSKMIHTCANVFFNIIVSITNLIIKRDSRILLFGSWMGEKFADNSRYLFQYCHYSEDFKKVIWVTRNKELQMELRNMGYNAYSMHSLKSYYFHLKAGVHFVCNVPATKNNFKGDILGQLSLKAMKVQLWHGIPLKGLKVKNDRRRLKWLKENIWINHFILSSGGWDNAKLLATSKGPGDICADALGLSKKNICISNYPRNLNCLELLCEEEKIVKRLNSEKKVKLLYLPTFRDKEESYVHPLAEQMMRKFVEEDDILWIEKPHSVDKSKNFKKFNQRILLNPNFDINTILPYVDILVTDYSSVSFDFLFLGKKVQYYVPDLSYYQNSDRGFSMDFKKNTDGWVSYEVNGLILNLSSQINQIKNNKNTKKTYSVISNLYDYPNKQYAEIINDLFKNK